MKLKQLTADELKVWNAVLMNRLEREGGTVEDTARNCINAADAVVTALRERTEPAA